VCSRTTVGTARAAGGKVALAVLPPLAAAALATAVFCLHAAVSSLPMQGTVTDAKNCRTTAQGYCTATINALAS